MDCEKPCRGKVGNHGAMCGVPLVFRGRPAACSITGTAACTSLHQCKGGKSGIFFEGRNPKTFKVVNTGKECVFRVLLGFFSHGVTIFTNSLPRRSMVPGRCLDRGTLCYPEGNCEHAIFFSRLEVVMAERCMDCEKPSLGWTWLWIVHFGLGTTMRKLHWVRNNGLVGGWKGEV